MGILTSTETHVIITPPLTWREPLWSKIYDFVRYRFFVPILLLCTSFAAAFFMVSSAVGMVSTEDGWKLNFFVGLAAFVLFTAGAAWSFLEVTKRYARSDRNSWSNAEVIRFYSKLPRRWKRKWAQYAGGEEKLESDLTHAFEVLHIKTQRDSERTLSNYEVKSRYSKYGDMVIGELRQSDIEYRFYPAAFLMLLFGVDVDIVEDWSESKLDFTKAYRLVIQGTDKRIIKSAVENDIDTSMIDSLLTGDNFS